MRGPDTPDTAHPVIPMTRFRDNAVRPPEDIKVIALARADPVYVAGRHYGDYWAEAGQLDEPAELAGPYAWVFDAMQWRPDA
jgi:hypothetical protein